MGAGGLCVTFPGRSQKSNRDHLLYYSPNDHACVEHFETNAGIARAQRAARPLAFKLPKGVFPFTGGQAPPFYFGHKEALPVIRVWRNQVQFDVALPVTLGAREARSAIVFKHGGGVVMDEFTLLCGRVGAPQGLMRRIYSKPKPHRRVVNAIERLLGGPNAFAEG